MSGSSQPTILLTGATGYVGSRLLTRLLRQDCTVRCFVRDRTRLREPPGDAVGVMEAVEGDILDPTAVARAVEGADIIYYLIHSMGSSDTFEDADRQAAMNLAGAARAAGANRIIYLGGLGDEQADLSPHLRSRHEVGHILREESECPVVEFRASAVIGSGSLSYEMIRALTERLPVMICPKWVETMAQPISILDLLAYLEAAAELMPCDSRIYEIGGADRMTYGDLMREYARQRGLKRKLIPVPVLTPRLSSLWLGLVTPLYARIGRKLVESLTFPTVVTHEDAARDFDIRPMGVADAIASALRTEDRAFVESHWADAVSSLGPEPSWAGVRFGNRLLDQRSIHTDVTPEQAFRPIRRIGGRTGWYYGNWLWTCRGAIDKLFGGPGMGRGRRDPDQLAVGDIVDCWRVEALEENRRLLLRAEMKLPGRAWLEFRVEPDGDGATIHQTAMFDPAGLAGLLYWYSIFPLHQLVFEGMLKGVVRAA